MYSSWFIHSAKICVYHVTIVGYKWQRSVRGMCAQLINRTVLIVSVGFSTWSNGS